MANRFSILFASDVQYFPHLATAIYSLLQNNRSLALRIILFTSEISVRDQEILHVICEKFSTPFEVMLLDESWFEGLVLNHHFKKSNYYRLFAAELIDDDKCLYLDSDIVVNGSISELMNKELHASYLAAVEDIGFDRHKELGMRLDSKYFNSGVMLLNLKKWRATNLKNLVVSFVTKNPAVILFVDQCGLNAIVDGGWIELDKKYNFQSNMVRIQEYEESVVNNVPIIVHYTGSSKPWQLNNNHPYKYLYWIYRNKTPYKAFFSDDFSFSTLARYLAPSLVKRFLKKFEQ